jgi:hypothetical protein
MTEQKSTISWNRLVVEGAVIIVSILLAFGIDAWWEERKDRIEEQEVLLGLQGEFELTSKYLAEAMAIASLRISDLEDLLVVMDKPEQRVDTLASDQFMQAMLAPSTMDLGSGVLDALLSSGRIELLENNELRARLSAWNGVLAEVNDDEQNNSRFIYERLIPYFVRNGVPVSGSMALWYKNWTAPKRHLSDHPEAFATMLQDPQFRTLAELFHGYLFHVIGEFESALDANKVILEEIEQSIN